MVFNSACLKIAITTLGQAIQIRVGRVGRNTELFFWP